MLFNLDIDMDKVTEYTLEELAVKFTPSAGSAAIGMGILSDYALSDFYGNPRSERPDVGAINYTGTTEIPEAPVLISDEEGDGEVTLKWSPVRCV